MLQQCKLVFVLGKFIILVSLTFVNAARGLYYKTLRIRNVQIP